MPLTFPIATQEDPRTDRVWYGLDGPPQKIGAYGCRFAVNDNFRILGTELGCAIEATNWLE